MRRGRHHTERTGTHMCASERLTRPSHRDRSDDPWPDDTTWPLLICVLGTFRVLQAGEPVAVHGAKTEALLCHLVLRYAEGVSRAVLLETLWPDSDAVLAGGALRHPGHRPPPPLGARRGGPP